MDAKTRKGVIRPTVCDNLGILLHNPAGASLADAAINGRLFSVANQTHVTTSDNTAALDTTWLGLGVGNPTTSGKLYVFHEFGWVQETLDVTTGVIGLMVATVGDMTQHIVPRCARYGYATTDALTDDDAEVGTPVIVRVFGSNMTGAINTKPSLTPNVFKLNGSIVLDPGYALLTYTFNVITNTILFHFVWEEIDIP